MEPATASPWVRRALQGVVLGACLVASGALAVDGGASPSRPRWMGPRPPAQVKRIVTLAPSLTETVISLGAGDRLVGVTRFDELPQVAKLPRVGGFVDPSIEAVLALEPDLVLVQPAPGNQAPVEKLAKLGVPVLALPLHTLEQVEAALLAVGEALGTALQAKKQVEEIRGTRQRIRARAQTAKSPRVLLVYGTHPLVVAGPGSFADALLRDAGAVNAAANAGAPYPVYSVEAAMRARPEVVLYTEMSEDVSSLRRLPGLAQARWVKLPSQDLLHPGPRLGQGLEELFALLHPRPVPDAGLRR